jgi:hypothetical protein
MKHLWLTLAVAAILGTTPARAEDVIPPRFEIGGNISGIVPIVFADGPVVVAGGGPRVTVNVTPRLAIDLLAEVIGPFESSGTMALYQTQFKLPIGRSPDGKRTVSFTVGAAGTGWYQRAPETRIPRLDGSTVVYPAYRRFQLSAPNTAAIGVAREEVFGVSFGLGGYR